MKSMIKSIAALAASVAIATASLTGVAAAAIQPLTIHTLVKNDSGIWVAEGGSIDVASVNTFSETFELDHGDITIGQGPNNGAQRTEFTADFGYENNYKWTSVVLNGEDGYASAYTPYEDKNKATVTAVITKDVGIINTGDYSSYLYAGSHSGTDYLERCKITVKRSKPV